MTLQLQFHLFRSKLSFRTLYDLDLNGAIEVRFFHRHMFIVVAKFGTLIR